MTDWFRSWHGAPSHSKWLAVARKAKVETGVVVAIVWTLMDRASMAEDRGSIEGYDAEGIAYFLGWEPEDVERVIKALHDKGILIENRFESWERRQTKRERDDDHSTARVREFRKRQADKNTAPSNSGPLGDETQNETIETDRNATKRLDKSRVEEIREEKEPFGFQKENPPPTSKEVKGAKRAQSLPDGLALDPDLIADAAKIGMLPARHKSEFEKFCDYHRSKGSLMKDWPAAWRTWCRNHVERFGKTGPPPPSIRQTTQPQLWRAD